jgi:integrase
MPRRGSMSVKQRGKFYHYQFMVNAVLYRGSTKQTTLGKARQFEADLMGKIVRGEAGPMVNRKTPTVKEFSVSFLRHIHAQVASGHLDKDTGRGYSNGVRLLLNTPIAGARLSKITTGQAAELTFPGSASNANQALRTLSRLLSYGVEVGVLHHAPRIGLREEYGREAIIEPWLEDLLIKHAPPRLADVIVIMLDCGMRPEEVCRMRWEHIRWNENAILVPHGKSQRARRHVGMTDRMRARFRDIEARNKKESPWIFPSRIKRLGHVLTVNKMWDETIADVRAATRKGGSHAHALPDGLVLYSARHTFATQFLANGGDLGKLMVLLGHASITTTQKYLHPSTSDAAEVMNRHNRNKLQIVRKRA